MDRVGERRAPRARRGKAGAKALLRDRKRRARLLPGRALLPDAGEPGPKLKTATAEEAGKARAAPAADEVEGPGADRARAGRGRARVGAERAAVPAEAERVLEGVAAKRARAEITAGHNVKGRAPGVSVARPFHS